MDWALISSVSWIIIPGLLGETSHEDDIIAKTIMRESSNAMPVIQNGFFAHDGYINYRFLGGCSYFLKLILISGMVSGPLGVSKNYLILYLGLLGVFD